MGGRETLESVREVDAVVTGLELLDAAAVEVVAVVGGGAAGDEHDHSAIPRLGERVDPAAHGTRAVRHDEERSRLGHERLEAGHDGQPLGRWQGAQLVGEGLGRAEGEGGRAAHEDRVAAPAEAQAVVAGRVGLEADDPPVDAHLVVDDDVWPDHGVTLGPSTDRPRLTGPVATSATPDGVSAGRVSARGPTVEACGCSTPPTGTSGARSTA